MGKRKQVLDGGLPLDSVQRESLATAMKEYADRKAGLEPVMLRLARIAGLREVESHIMNVRKIVKTRAQVAG